MRGGWRQGQHQLELEDGSSISYLAAGHLLDWCDGLEFLCCRPLVGLVLHKMREAGMAALALPHKMSSKKERRDDDDVQMMVRSVISSVGPDSR